MPDKADIDSIAAVISEKLEIDPGFLPPRETYDESYEQLRAILVRRIEELIESDFEHLMWILYRIDVAESRLKKTLAEFPEAPPAEIITDMVIKRQLEKVETRRKYSSSGEGEDSPDWDFDV